MHSNYENHRVKQRCAFSAVIVACVLSCFLEIGWCTDTIAGMQLCIMISNGAIYISHGVLSRGNGAWITALESIRDFRLVLLPTVTPIGIVGYGFWCEIPLILVLLLVGILHRMRRHPILGVCTTCGYSLRGIKGKRCPECGNATDNESVDASASSVDSRE